MAGDSWWRENVVKPIHNTRIPLPKIFGVHATVYMQFVYPSLVVLAGLVLFQITTAQADKNLGVNGEKLRGRGDLSHPGTKGQNQALDKFLIEASKR
jgi:hypothetical protein